MSKTFTNKEKTFILTRGFYLCSLSPTAIGSVGRQYMRAENIWYFNCLPHVKQREKWRKGGRERGQKGGKEGESERV